MEQFTLQTFMYIDPAENIDLALVDFRTVLNQPYFAGLSPTIKHTARPGQLSFECNFSAPDADGAEEKADHIIHELLNAVAGINPCREVSRGSDMLAYA
ncbi:hypothetical protein P4N68_08535 [Corynebacterium felinum]|uniref:Uncharacterized protein n=1 Tax=Corynebacterium felinum TaxID=131318 RepID=A0ABU2B6M4_9CORY|nr:hypothetical protein [Corynebacterium felinum]MDF5821122.1 hypothetical protein [Corynebacterium felinum]MDR7354051.1 hypothetical protein [Corynebacterium felinum]WJY96224.1 hypothetical protein CFELI_13225 [Corynebacterium felinum]